MQSKRIFTESGAAPTLNSGDREGGGIQPSVLQSQCIDYKQTPKVNEEICHTLTRGGDGGIHSAIAFKYSAGAAARTMPTYSDGSCNTLTADYHSPAVALQTGHTAANGSGINTDDVSYTVSTSMDQAVAFTQNQRDEVRYENGDGQVVGALHTGSGKNEHFVCQPADVLCMASAAANAEIGEQICPTIMAHAAKTPPIVLASNDECVGALCARDHKGVGSQYFEEGKVICQRVTKGPSC